MILLAWISVFVLISFSFGAYPVINTVDIVLDLNSDIFGEDLVVSLLKCDSWFSYPSKISFSVWSGLDDAYQISIWASNPCWEDILANQNLVVPRSLLGWAILFEMHLFIHSAKHLLGWRSSWLLMMWYILFLIFMLIWWHINDVVYPLSDIHANLMTYRSIKIHI